MKRIVVSLILLFFNVCCISAQCNLGHVTLRTQSDIDNFIAVRGTCTVVSILRIKYPTSSGAGFQDTEITNLNGISHLTSCGSLEIVGNPLLTTLSPLSNLTTSGTVSISYNNALTDLAGLEGLEDISSLQIRFNDNLGSLSGLENLNKIATTGSLLIDENPLLSDISDLSQLSGPTGGLSISYNPLLSSLEGLEGITSCRNVLISSMPLLNNFEGLGSLESVEKEFQIVNCANSNFVGFESLRTIGGRLSIESCSNLTNFQGFESLEKFGASSGHKNSIYNNPSLVDFTGLESLDTINWTTLIWDNDNLESLNGLESLSKINGTLEMNSNPKFESLAGTGALNISGALILRNSGIENLSGFNVTNIGAYILLQSNSYITSLEGIPTDANIGGFRLLSNNNLSVCDIEQVCALIDNTPETHIVNNGTGCETKLEIQESCDPCSAGSVVYVDVDALGNGNGTSWEDAFTSLQSGIDLAHTCDSATEVWVAQGTYKPTLGSDRSISFRMKNGVSIYGGFEGDEVMLEERDIIAYSTILSGEIGDQNSTVDNSYHIIYNENLDNAAIIDGFTITAGASNGPNQFDDLTRYGGGVLNNNSSVSINHCIFQYNTGTTGSALANTYGSNPTIFNCEFSNNEASVIAGAIYNWTSSIPIFNSCLFSSNQSPSSGGAMYNSGTSPIIQNCQFTDNHANSKGGAIHTFNGSPSISDCAFSGNSADVEGGAINDRGGSMSTISSCTFENNTAESGGAIILDNANSTISSCLFKNNSAAVGGAIYSWNGSISSVENCRFISNNATQRGGAVRNSGANPNFINCSFNGNTADIEGGAIGNFNSNPSITNCILWNNQDEIHNNSGSTPVVSYSLIQGGYSGTGNVDANPLFTNAPSDLTLQQGSPAINAGTETGAPSEDFNGDPRPQMGGVDMGAYESPFASSIPGCTDPSAHNYDASATDDDGSCETCIDGIQNGDEEDIDCGGQLCNVCPCTHPDVPALVALYNTTNGPDWADNTGWLDNSDNSQCDPCSWFGVTCNQDGRVSIIDLEGNGLDGNIPPQIGDLSELEELNLSNDFFAVASILADGIPDEITQLTNLRKLFLNGNDQLGGEIPEEIGELTNLTHFGCTNCGLEGELPESLYELSNLTFITLANNDLEGELSEDIDGLENLASGYFNDNNLSGELPESLIDLENLAVFSVQSNDFSGCFPDSYSDFCGMSSYSFSENPELTFGGDFAQLCNIGIGFCSDIEDCSNGVQDIHETNLDCGGLLCNPCDDGYCDSQGNSVKDEWIQSISIGGQTKTSGNNGGYANYTDINFNLTNNTNYAITLMPGYTGANYQEGWQIWIDFNQNDQFDGFDELITVALGTGTINQTFTMPLSVPDGITTRMRVAMKYNGLADPCEAFPFGEVEDYTVTLTHNCISALDNPNQTIILDSQQDVDDFANIYCPNVVNSIFVYGAGITNLDGLSSLETVGGVLAVYDAPDLADLSGLANLQSTGNYLALNNLDAATEISLPSLTSVGGYLDMNLHENLSSFSAPNLQSVGAALVFIYNNALSSISLPSLTSVGGYFASNFNTAVESISFPMLTSVQGYVDVNQCPALLNVQMPNLMTLGASVVVQDCPLLNDFNMSQLTSIGGSFQFARNNALTNLGGFASLESVTGGYFFLADHPSLEHLDALSNLMYVDNFVSIYDNANLSMCCGVFPLITDGTVVNSIHIYSNADGCNSPTQIQSECVGCTDPLAHNYNSGATSDDGSCETCYDGILNGNETSIDCGPHCTSVLEVTFDCPTDVTLVCNDNYDDLALVGFAFASNSCGELSVTYQDNPNLDADNMGAILRTWTVIDRPEISCVQVITLAGDEADSEMPVPDVTTLPQIVAQCEVTLTPPSATDNCAGVLTATTEDPLTYIQQGIYSVSWKYDDGNGNILYQGQQVVIEDTEDPIPTIDDLPVIYTQCQVSLTAPTAMDNCVGEIIASTENPIFYNEQGTFTVTWKYDDGHGNIVYQDQEIVIDDTEAPVVMCPQDIVVDVDPNSCGATIALPAIDVMDNCVGYTVTTSHQSGTFDVGTTVVEVDVVDLGNNITSCSYSITVIDNIAPSVTCPQDIVVDTDANSCFATVVLSDVQATDNCDQDLTFTYSHDDGEFAIGATKVTATVSDDAGNQSMCIFHITVEDNQAPEFDCPEPIEVSNSLGVCFANVDLAEVIATDNCGNVSLSYSHDTDFEYPVGETEVTITATDDTQNITSCGYLVTVIDQEAPSLTCPSDLTFIVESGLCEATVHFPQIPSTDNCDPSPQVTYSISSGSVFSVGQTEVVVTSTDQAGESSSCSFMVFVLDEEAPSITCPIDIPTFVNINSENNTYVVPNDDWDPSFEDNCTVILSNNINSTSTLENHEFELGTYDIIWTATDASGNESSCAYTIEVTSDIDDFRTNDIYTALTEAETGESFFVSCQQEYQGSSTSTIYVNMGYYLSEDDQWSADDILLATDVSSLSMNDLGDYESATITIPSGYDAGLAYILFVADHDHQYSEPDEMNNVRSTPIEITEADIALDNFWIEDATVSLSTASVGADIMVSCDQYYDGTSTSTLYPRVGYYISEDQDWNPADDILLGDDVSTLSGNDFFDPESATLSLENIEVGDYFILFVADYQALYDESDEMDNIVSLPIIIVESSGSTEDVFISNTSLTISTLSVGDVTRAKCRQNYAGTGTSNASINMEYYYSVDQVFDGTDVLLATDISSIGTSDPWDTESAYVTIPNTAAPGQGFILFVADTDEEIIEIDEDNNVEYLEISIVSNSSLEDQVGKTDTENNHVVTNRTISEEKYEEEEFGLAELKVYPNPSTGMFNLLTEREEIFTYEIFDSKGMKVKTGNTAVFEIDLTNFVPGIYYLRWITKNGIIQSKRIIVMR